jgi:hypothetical protein
MLRLATSRQASAQLQMDEATLQQSAEARNIKPFCNVNGVDFYDMADFGEAAVLLRASSAPAPIEELLRPAANSETPTELLLRPASSNDMPTAIVETSPNAESREEAARLHVGGE